LVTIKCLDTNIRQGRERRLPLEETRCMLTAYTISLAYLKIKISTKIECYHILKTTNLQGYKIFPIFQSAASKQMCCLKVEEQTPSSSQTLRTPLYLKRTEDSKELLSI
jgi:hypothetical protein